MSTITPCLWFDGNAEEAAEFYASVLPDSRVAANRALESVMQMKRIDIAGETSRGRPTQI